MEVGGSYRLNAATAAPGRVTPSAMLVQASQLLLEPWVPYTPPAGSARNTWIAPSWTTGVITAPAVLPSDTLLQPLHVDLLPRLV